MKLANADLLKKNIILLWFCKKRAAIPKKYTLVQESEDKLAMNCIPLCSDKEFVEQVTENIKQNKIGDSE